MADMLMMPALVPGVSSASILEAGCISIYPDSLVVVGTESQGQYRIAVLSNQVVSSEESALIEMDVGTVHDGSLNVLKRFNPEPLGELAVIVVRSASGILSPVAVALLIGESIPASREIEVELLNLSLIEKLNSKVVCPRSTTRN